MKMNNIFPQTALIFSIALLPNMRTAMAPRGESVLWSVWVCLYESLSISPK